MIARPDSEPVDHEPVLLKEVIAYLDPSPGDVIVDCTLGYGGHSIDILKRLGGEGLLVGFDLDPLALEIASQRMEQSRARPTPMKLVASNFVNLTSLLDNLQAPLPSGILFDLGPSTPQLLSSRLGMSWESDEALDMRLDPQADSIPAAEIVNTWNEEDLARLFREHAQERWSRRIARWLIKSRRIEPVTTGRQLGRIVSEAIPRKAWPRRIHPATRVFLALRIEVNREFENLESGLIQAEKALAPKGRLVVISFHSGEDRRVKQFMRAMAKPEDEAPWPLPQRGMEGQPRMKILTPKPVRPSKEEIARNPRSRSARLRCAEKAS